MRKALFVVAVVAATSVSACALEEEATDSDVGQAADEWVDPEDSTDILEAHPDGEAAARAGCSVVEWCQAPGFDGTRCVQTGCARQRRACPARCAHVVSRWVTFVVPGIVRHPEGPRRRT